MPSAKEKLSIPLTFSVYINRLFFGNIRSVCTNISHQYNCTIVADLNQTRLTIQNDYLLHAKLQKTLNNNKEFYNYLQTYEVILRIQSEMVF